VSAREDHTTGSSTFTYFAPVFVDNNAPLLSINNYANKPIKKSTDGFSVTYDCVNGHCLLKFTAEDLGSGLRFVAYDCGNDEQKGDEAIGYASRNKKFTGECRTKFDSGTQTITMSATDWAGLTSDVSITATFKEAKQKFTGNGGKGDIWSKDKVNGTTGYPQVALDGYECDDDIDRIDVDCWRLSTRAKASDDCDTLTTGTVRYYFAPTHQGDDWISVGKSEKEWEITHGCDFKWYGWAFYPEEDDFSDTDEPFNFDAFKVTASRSPSLGGSPLFKKMEAMCWVDESYAKWQSADHNGYAPTSVVDYVGDATDKVIIESEFCYGVFTSESD